MEPDLRLKRLTIKCLCHVTDFVLFKKQISVYNTNIFQIQEFFLNASQAGRLVKFLHLLHAWPTANQIKLYLQTCSSEQS